MKKYLTIIFFTLFCSCKKIYYYPDNELGEANTVALAHGGCGGNSEFKINTYDGALFGLANMPGIEVDVQLSKNSTVWLSHDPTFYKCNSDKQSFFRSTSDKEIENLDSCLGPEKDFTKLEDIFKYMSVNCPEKYISIDVKAWFNVLDIEHLDMIGEMNVIADEIIKLKYKYRLNHVMVESQTATFLNYVKQNSYGIECYLSTWGDFERGMGIVLKKKFNGISFKYKFKEAITADHIKMLHKKGLKIMLWTVNNDSDIQEALQIKPDFIQTDNLHFFSK
jgi:glycerophosphoryl diester phosphodiesterase